MCSYALFANVGTIPEFEKLLATMRSMEISANVILQNISQLKKLYEKSWEDIKGNCDSFLFLGGQEMSTLEEVSKALGKETIDVKSSNRTKSHRNNSTAENNSIIGRELLMPDELMRVDCKKCILIINREYPFFGKKYDITKHPNYKFLEDADSSNKFDFRSVITLKNQSNLLSPQEKEEIYEDFLSEPFEEGEEFILSEAEEPAPQKPAVNQELQKIIKENKVTRKTNEATVNSEILSIPEEDVFDESVTIPTGYSDTVSNFEDEVITSLSINGFISNYNNIKEDSNEVDITQKFTSESELLSETAETTQGSITAEIFNNNVFATDAPSALENEAQLPDTNSVIVLSQMTMQFDPENEFDYTLI